MGRKKGYWARTREKRACWEWSLLALLTGCCGLFVLFFAVCGNSSRSSEANQLERPPTEQQGFDIVYTWVNGSDPAFLKVLGKFAPTGETRRRYQDREELRYSLRSLEKFFEPWVRKVFMVTNGQVPYWLNTQTVTLISHDQFYLHLSHLPTFSSSSIESNIWRIPGLSDRFIYFNDDLFLGAPVTPHDFLSPLGVPNIYLSWEIPDCSPECSDSLIGTSQLVVQRCN